MNRRKLAIQVIVADVAQHGKAGQSALRAYVENRVSRDTFNKACQLGMQIYERGQRIGDTEHPFKPVAI